MTLFVVFITAILFGMAGYYIGYMTGTEKEHNRLCEQWMRERREDGE